jgi:hypothetical protein
MVAAWRAQSVRACTTQTKCHLIGSVSCLRCKMLQLVWLTSTPREYAMEILIQLIYCSRYEHSHHEAPYPHSRGARHSSGNQKMPMCVHWHVAGRIGTAAPVRKR